MPVDAALQAYYASTSANVGHGRAAEVTAAAPAAMADGSLVSNVVIRAALGAGRVEVSSQVDGAAAQSWPAELPNPRRRSYAARDSRGTWRFEPEVGPAVEILGAWQLHELDCEFVLDEAQLKAWEAFYLEELRGGELPFRGRSPWTRPAWLYLLAAPPEVVRRASGGYLLRLRLVGVPA